MHKGWSKQFETQYQAAESFPACFSVYWAFALVYAPWQASIWHRALHTPGASMFKRNPRQQRISVSGAES